MAHRSRAATSCNRSNRLDMSSNGVGGEWEIHNATCGAIGRHDYAKVGSIRISIGTDKSGDWPFKSRLTVACRRASLNACPEPRFWTKGKGRGDGRLLGGPSERSSAIARATMTGAGWYPDAHDPSLVRWWDGHSWTTHTQANPAWVPPVPSMRSRFVVPVQAAAALGPHASGAQTVPHAAPAGPRGQVVAQAPVASQVELAVHEATSTEVAALRAEAASWRAEIDRLRDQVNLIEAGVYRYSHPLDSATAYKAKLKELESEIDARIKNGSAVSGAKNWSINGSPAEGSKMVSDFCKLVLRSYNNEADNAVRALKPHTLTAAKKRLETSRTTIAKLGARVELRVTDEYHELRLRELDLTADYLQRLAEEKEREREVRERQREEEIVRRELEEKRAKLEKERAQHIVAIQTLLANGDLEGAARMEAKVAVVDQAIQGVIERAANTRAGTVYIISNVGAFGAGVVKIGLTRRENPDDRVRELGDASVPFHFDTHAKIWADDAVALETKLHHAFKERRVNMINAHREFFFVSPQEVRDELARHAVEVLTFTVEHEAEEWKQSRQARGQSISIAPPPDAVAARLAPREQGL